MNKKNIYIYIYIYIYITPETPRCLRHKLQKISKSLNLNQVSRGLQLGWAVDSKETYYECISSLSPGFNLHYKNGKITKKKYWEIQ